MSEANDGHDRRDAHAGSAGGVGGHAGGAGQTAHAKPSGNAVPGSGSVPESESDAADDRRGDDRAPITLRVDYKRLNTFFADYTKNISKGGTFIRTTRPLEVGTEFMFVLSVPSVGSPNGAAGAAPGAESSDSVQLELAGIVKWVVREDDASKDKPAGMGIQFVFANDSDREKVEALVAGMMREALGSRLTQKLLGRST
jgi:type IV pilus assembly protein PilZ